jgi:PIN domain nuclease of toxin-antitoxin system
VNYLLDTHTFLWWIDDDTRLSETVREIITNPDNEIVVSVISTWEIIIKYSLGKLELSESPKNYIEEMLTVNEFTVLPIKLVHTFEVAELPNHHKDPFDRLLIAQSRLEQIPIVTLDRQIIKYPVQTIW